MIIKNILPSFICLLILSAEAQEQRISGTIIDSETKDPLPFSHVGIFNTSYGTISNIDGKFSLIIPAGYSNSKLSASYLGYEINSIDISSINPDEVVKVSLNPTITKLPESVITLKQQSIIDEAIEAIPLNHDQGKMQLRAFWRASIKNISEQYVQMTEYAFDMFRYGEIDKELNNMKILRGRVARDTSFFEDIGGLQIGVTPPSLFTSSLLKEHPILDKKIIRKHSYKITDVTSLNGRAVYIISFKPKEKAKGKLFEGQILLDTESLAFVKISFKKLISDENPEKVFDTFSLASMVVGLGKSTMDKYDNELNYQLIGDKWYLSHAKYDINWTMRKSNNNAVRPVSFKADFVVTDIKKKNIIIPPTEEFASTQILEKQATKNSDEYWRDYNYLLADNNFEELFQEILDRK
ncbi:MAG: carboxypeptidase-like regulatory domain-containing protein [Ekhidna sp.]